MNRNLSWIRSPEAGALTPCDCGGDQQEEEILLFFLAKDSADVKTYTHCLPQPVHLLFPTSMKVFSFSCCARTWTWITMVADSKLLFTADPEFIFAGGICDILFQVNILGVFIGTREDHPLPKGGVSKQVQYPKLRLFLLTAFIASWSLKVCPSHGSELHSAFEAFWFLFLICFKLLSF